MTLLWAVPVVAAAAAMVLVVAMARTLEDEAVGLAHEVQELGDLRAPLSAVRDTTLETDQLVATFRHQHPVDGRSAAPDHGGIESGEA